MSEALTPIPVPEMTELSRPFWDALRQGTLTFQRCQACGHAWLPARSECPSCLGDAWQREAATGNARLVSWVVYHQPYHPAFKQRLPYTVAAVQLDEGPRMISNIVGAEAAPLQIDQRLRLRIENEGEISVPHFTPV